MKHIVLEDLDFDWTKQEMIKILNLWHYGFSLEDISLKMNRDYDECSLVLIDVGNNIPSLVPQRSNGRYTSEPIKTSKRYNSKIAKMFEKSNVYTMLSKKSINFFWTMKEVDQFTVLWNENCSISYMARKKFKRSLFETTLLIIDQCKKNRISSRKIGVGEEAFYL